MPATIFAGELTEWRPSDDGPTFTIKAIDYWAIQPVLTETDPAAKMRKVMELGLIAINGDTDAVAKFIAAPGVAFAGDVYSAIWSATWGN